MKTDNELIAEFIELEIRSETAVIQKRYKFGDHFYNHAKLKFHSSWDWLMKYLCNFLKR